MLKITYVNQYDKDNKYKKIIVKTLKTAYRYLGLTEKTIVNVILVDNEEIQKLNKTYRDMDKPTDVLSFENDYDLYEIGDVFISIPKAIQQADEYKHSFERELAFLVLHGFLHCIGYDHMNEKDEAEMFALQNKILEKTNFTR